MLAPTVARGFSDDPGSWKTMPIRPSAVRFFLPRNVARFTPATSMVPGLRRDQADDRRGERALARAGFADKAEYFARFHVHADPVHRVHRDRPEPPTVHNGQIADAQCRFRGRTVHNGSFGRMADHGDLRAAFDELAGCVGRRRGRGAGQ